jgi:transglutaminase-like putative cysteine protease
MERQMRRYRIVHRTYYNFSAPVRLGAHALRLRPREGHDLRIESSTLEITPKAVLYWQRDAESNSLATAVFDDMTAQLAIVSDLVVQQFPPASALGPAIVVIGDAAADRTVLAPYLHDAAQAPDAQLADWLGARPCLVEAAQSHAALEALCLRISNSLQYRARDEPGVRPVDQTLAYGNGSCRDFAQLFIAAARAWGFAARFVSGYLHAPPTPDRYGATHAWAEVYLAGAGWCGFDPTLGRATGAEHFAVAVARLPESVPPVAGSIITAGAGAVSTTMDVGVWVSGLPATD